ncbi:MAG: hypothetical protein U9R75_12755 [Candidatus Thermoplasmatota archaeon]|nr:hypothetical protein [Candidatus Thermoplasmatota archaeon]
MGTSRGKTEEKKEETELVSSSSDQVESRIDTLKNLGMSIKGLRGGLRNLKKARKKGSEKSIVRERKDLERSISDIWDKWLDKRILMNMVFARRSIKAVEEKKQDPTGPGEILARVERSIDGNDRAGTFEALEELRSSVGVLLSGFPDITLGQAWSSMERSFDSYIEIADGKTRIDEARKHFKKTVKLVEKGDIDNSLVYSNILYTTIQSDLSDDVAKDRFKVIKEDVEQLMKTMEEFKKYGFENSSMEKDMSKLESMMKSNKMGDANTTMKRLNKNVSRVENEFFRRKGAVSILEVNDLIEEYGSLIDLEEYSRKVEKVARDQTKMSPKKFMEGSTDLLEEVRSTLFDNFEGQVTERMKTLEERIPSISDETDRNDLMDLKERVSSALMSRDITEAMEYLSIAESILGHADDEMSLVRIQEDYGHFLSGYEVLLNEDIEMEELKDDIADIERMFLQDDVLSTGIDGKVSAVEVRIKDRIVEVRKEKLGSEKESMLGLLNSLNLPSDRLEKYQDRFYDFETRLSSLEEEEYRSEIANIRKEVNGEISEFFRDNYDDWATDLQSSLEELGDRNVNVSDLQSKLDDASKHHRDRDYLTSGKTLKNLKDEINEIENESLIKDVEEQIDSAEFLFDEASRSGVDVEGKKEELEMAKELLGSGKIKEAGRLAGQIENDVKSQWKEEKRSQIENDLQELKGFMDETDQLGLDISDVGGMVEEAETLFQDDRLEEVNEVVMKARETIDSEKSMYYSEGALGSIKELKEDIASMGDLGINTLESETLLIEAERLFMSEDYEQAYSVTLDIREHLNGAKETFYKEQIPRKMDNVLKKVGRLEVMGLEADAARNYVKIANRSSENGDPAAALDNLDKAEEVSEEIFKSHISLAIPETIIDVQKQIEETVLDGLEVDDVQSMLSEAEGLFQNEDYDTAMDTVERAQETFNSKREDYFRTHYQSNLESVEDIMERATGLDMELELSRDNLNMAQDAYEREDYESSHKLMERVMKFLDKSMVDKETGKRREVVQTYYDEVNTLLMVSDGENIETIEERELFKLAGEQMTEGDFDQAEHLLEGIKVSLNEKRMQMKKNLIESSIKTSEILLGNMNEMGVNTDHENRLIEELKEALRKGDLDQCEEINYQLTNALQKNQGPVLVQKVQRSITELRARIVDANRKGLDVEQAKSYLSDATELFELGDVETSQDKVESSNRIMDELIMEYHEEEYLTIRSSLQTRVEELKELGIPADDEEEIMENADILFRDGEIDRSKGFLEMARIGAVAKLDSFRSTTAESYIEQITRYLSELGSQDVDTSDLTRVFEEGMEFHQCGEDEKAVSKFSSILELGEEIRTLHDLGIEKARCERLEEFYIDLKAAGLKGSKKITRLIREVKKVLDEDSPPLEKIAGKLTEVEDLLDRKKGPYMGELVKKRMVEARKAITEFKERGVDDTDLNKLFKEAGDHFRKDEFDETENIIRMIMENIDNYHRKESGMQLKEEVGQVKQMLTRLKTLGSNVSTAENLLSRVKVALDESRTENAEKLIHSVRSSIKEIVRRNMRETALETIEFTDAMIHYLIDNFSGITKDLKPAEEKLNRSRELFREKKFKAAKSLSEEARDMVEQLELQNIKQFLYVFRSMQADEMERDVSYRLGELSSKGIDTSKARMLFENAKGNFEKDEFDKGRQMITLARIMLSELDQQSLRDKAFDELNNAHVEILTEKKKGANITTAYKTYNSAKESFSMREYKKSILLSKRAHYQARKAS